MEVIGTRRKIILDTPLSINSYADLEYIYNIFGGRDFTVIFETIDSDGRTIYLSAYLEPEYSKDESLSSDIVYCTISPANNNYLEITYYHPNYTIETCYERYDLDSEIPEESAHP